MCLSWDGMLIQSTLAWRTPRYYGYLLLQTKSSPRPGESYRCLTENDFRYCGLSLLRTLNYVPRMSTITRVDCIWGCDEVEMTAFAELQAIVVTIFRKKGKGNFNLLSCIKTFNQQLIHLYLLTAKVHSLSKGLFQFLKNKWFKNVQDPNYLLQNLILEQALMQNVPITS